MQLIQTGVNDPTKRRILLHLVDATDGITPETGEAGTKCKISVNYGAPADTDNAIVAFDTTNAPGDYYLELSLREIQFPGILVIRYKSANTAHFVQEAQVVAFDPETWRGPLIGGGGPDIDYKRIEKLIAAQIGKMKMPEMPEMPMCDHKDVLHAITGVSSHLSTMKMPEMPQMDMSPVMAKCDALMEAIKAMKFPETDIAPIMSALEEMKGHEMSKMATVEQAAEVSDKAAEMLGKMQGFFLDDVEEIKDGVREMNQKFDGIPYVVIERKNKEIKQDEE